jgi:poly-gamma-glutamate capsule biosynthesis protein CapA/YwtB (metallophosphatase superfamily)
MSLCGKKNKFLNYVLIVFSCIVFLHGNAQQELSFLFAGDVMSHGPQIAAARNELTDSYDYDAGFQFVKPIIEQHDIAIANLEVTHAGKPYSGYPQFSAPDELSPALINAGFDVLLTCNNHSCDGGAKGVIRTLDVLDKLGIKHTGTFRNKAERDLNYPLMLNQNGMKVAILNYTYGTNGIVVATPLIINYIDSAVIKKDFKRAKELNADYIICTMHWGTEYESLPSAYQKKWEKYCYELGVDMVIGSHPHVIQPMQKKVVNGKEKLTVWSMGNYVSNQKDRYKNGGLMVGTTLKKENGKVSIEEIHHSFAYVHIKQEKGSKYYYLLPEFNYAELRPDFMADSAIFKMEQFFMDSRKLFAEHSIGSSEYIVSQESEIGILYSSYLKGYYSVLLEERSDTKSPELLKTELSNYIHKVIEPNGKYAYVSGIYNTKEQAYGNKRFFQDCLVSNPLKIVFISPQEFTLIEE